MNTIQSSTHLVNPFDGKETVNIHNSVLRFITCGSVDDGKSTLIGRLLYDSKAVFADQIEAIGRAKHKRTASNIVDLSLLTDGLEAEREQGITIDVAYRYFATPHRKFIIADTPGHEQYTRNMVTGASTADAALLLIDPTRVHNGNLLPQTKRHAALAKLLGIRHIIAVVNKMDLIDYSQSKYNEIVELLDHLSHNLNLPSLTVVPVSALQGDNVVNTSEFLSWYKGQPLLRLLEQLPNHDKWATNHAMRFIVQYVIRTDGNTIDDFRGFSGFLASGSIRLGDTVHIPNGATANISRLHTFDGDLTVAHTGDAVTLVLDRDIDVSRGDILISNTDTAMPVLQFNADLCWMDTNSLNSSRKYWLKMGAKTVYAKISKPIAILDITHINYIEPSSTYEFGLNAIGISSITVQTPILVEDYHHNKTMGSFILIDTASHQTVAAGMVRLN